MHNLKLHSKKIVRTHPSSVPDVADWLQGDGVRDDQLAGPSGLVDACHRVLESVSVVEALEAECSEAQAEIASLRSELEEAKRVLRDQRQKAPAPTEENPAIEGRSESNVAGLVLSWPGDFQPKH